MKERPILFSAPMVRAILAGNKTQTRRVVKPAEMQRADDIEPHESYPGEWTPWIDGERRSTIECPYGHPGDRLWVRETWRTHSIKHDKIRPVELSPHGDVVIHYDASMQFIAPFLGKGRPSIHMPRWASRITLEITGVRVEMLGDITEQDASAEGVSSVAAFVDLWKLINHSWEPRTWVWALQFQRV